MAGTMVHTIMAHFLQVDTYAYDYIVIFMQILIFKKTVTDLLLQASSHVIGGIYMMYNVLT